MPANVGRLSPTRGGIVQKVRHVSVIRDQERLQRRQRPARAAGRRPRGSSPGRARRGPAWSACAGPRAAAPGRGAAPRRPRRERPPAAAGHDGQGLARGATRRAERRGELQQRRPLAQRGGVRRAGEQVRLRPGAGSVGRARQAPRLTGSTAPDLVGARGTGRRTSARQRPSAAAADTAASSTQAPVVTPDRTPAPTRRHSGSAAGEGRQELDRLARVRPAPRPGRGWRRAGRPPAPSSRPAPDRAASGRPLEHPLDDRGQGERARRLDVDRRGAGCRAGGRPVPDRITPTAVSSPARGGVDGRSCLDILPYRPQCPRGGP